MQRALGRISGAALVLGSIVGLVFNAMHPRNVDFSNFAESTLGEINGSSMWVGIHLGLTLAIVLGVLGAAGFSRSVQGDVGGALARLGFVGALLGGGILLVVLAIDGVAAKVLAQNWASATGEGKDVALAVGGAIVSIGMGLLAIANIVNFGFTAILFGTAVVASTNYPKLLGWVGVVTGTASLLVGVFIGYDGVLTAETLTAFVVTSIAFTIWLLILGIQLWRKAGTATA